MGLKFPADILIGYFCLSPFYINHLNQKKHIFLRLTEPSALSQEAKLAEFPKTSIPALRRLLTFPEKVLIFSKLFSSLLAELLWLLLIILQLLFSNQL